VTSVTAFSQVIFKAQQQVSILKDEIKYKNIFKNGPHFLLVLLGAAPLTSAKPCRISSKLCFGRMVLWLLVRTQFALASSKRSCVIVSDFGYKWIRPCRDTKLSVKKFGFFLKKKPPF